MPSLSIPCPGRKSPEGFSSGNNVLPSLNSARHPSGFLPFFLLTVPLFGIPSGCIEAFPIPAEAAPISSSILSEDANLPVLTLDQAIRLALGRSPVLAQERARVAQEAAGAVKAGELPDPKLVLGEQYFPIDFNTNTSVLTMTTVGIRQSFPSWGKRPLLERSSLKDEQASRWTLDDRKRLLVRDVRLAWLDLYRTEQTEKFLEAIGSLWQKTFRSALVRYQQGIGSESDVLSAQYQKDEIRDKMESLRLQKEKSLHHLMRLMNRSRPFEISPGEPRLPDPLPERDLLEHLDTHPALESWGARNAAQKLRVQAARKDTIPSFSVEGDYSYFMGPNLVTATPNLFSVVVSLNLPVRPGERQDQEIRVEEKTLEAQEAGREIQRQRLAEEIRNAEGTYRHLGQRIFLAERILLPEAQRNVEAAMAAYKTGTVPMDRVMAALKKEEDAGIRALSLRTERLKTMARLSYLAGSHRGGSHEP